jgi:cytochrome c553
MPRIASLILLLALALVSAAGCAFASAADPSIERGRRIYEAGIGGDGRPVQALSAGDSRLSGPQAACTVCHRRSGMGSREGRVAVSPVTGPILYGQPASAWPQRPGRAPPVIEPLRQERRPPYDDDRLARAIRSGVDSGGAPLAALMPRYALSEADAQALVAFLRQHAARPPTGLDGETLHLATIITPDADPSRAAIVADTMTAWARAGALGGMPVDLQVWRLEGESDGWTRQLQALNERRPVYAVLSGAGRARWAPVRDFCEQAGVPCLFPIVDLAPDDGQDFYSLYLSRGVTLEARILARQIQELTPSAVRVVQLVDDEAGEQAARVLAELLGPQAQVTRAWQTASGAALLADLRATDVLVGWLSPTHLDRLSQLRPMGPGVRWALFSAQLAPPEQTELPPAWRQAARWVSLRSDPQRLRGKGVLGLTPWLAQLQLPPGDEATRAEIYAATYFFSDALARMRGQWSREYLLETLESAHYTRPAGAAYYALSLAPGQREAAKAAHLLGYAGPEMRQLVPMGPRLSP